MKHPGGWVPVEMTGRHRSEYLEDVHSSTGTSNGEPIPDV